MPEISFNGTVGRLEGRYQPGAFPSSPLALILHPHPQHGGSMNNKVTYALYKTFVEQGFSTLRFNFRGVGRSEGTYTGGEGELSDATSALNWLQEMNPLAHTFWVAGFSFGAWIGMQLLMRRPELKGFVAVSPPADRYSFAFLAPCPVGGLIVQGGRDEIVAAAVVNQLAQKLKSQKSIPIEYALVENANHFFTDHMPEFQKILAQYIAGIAQHPVGKTVAA